MKLCFSEPGLDAHIAVLAFMALLCHVKFIMAHSDVFRGFRPSHRRGITLLYDLVKN